MRGFVTRPTTARVPGFWRICAADAYMFKLCCIFLPLLLSVLVYNSVAGRPSEDYMLPAVFTAGLIAAAGFRWYCIAGAFREHEIMQCRVLDISPATGLFGLQVFVSFYDSCTAASDGRGCFLVRFNRCVKMLKKDDLVTVFWNYKNLYVIKDAYLDE